MRITAGDSSAVNPVAEARRSTTNSHGRVAMSPAMYDRSSADAPSM